MAPAVVTRPAVEPAPVSAPARDEVDALIEEARRRQRRRRRVLGSAMAVVAVAATVSAYVGLARDEGGTSALRRESPAVASGTLQLRLAGFGTPLASAIDSGPCPQGRTVIAIRSAAGARIGTERECVLTISRADVPGYGLERIVQTVSATYALRGGTIVTRERQTLLFARDQRHTTAVFRGTVLRGTGRLAHARGTVAGGGPGLDGRADWRLAILLG